MGYNYFLTNMNNDQSKYTSVELGKWLEERGFKKETEHGFYQNAYDNYETWHESNNPHYWKSQPHVKRYHILDLVIDHGKELFGEDDEQVYVQCDEACSSDDNFITLPAYKSILIEIALLITDGDMKVVERYFINNCILKPKA